MSSEGYNVWMALWDMVYRQASIFEPSVAYLAAREIASDGRC